MWQIAEVEKNEEEKIKGFLAKTNASFLQSFEWGDFQQEVGRKVWRVKIFEESKIYLFAQIFLHFLPFNKSYFYCPHGPVVDFEAEPSKRNENLKKSLELLRNYFKSFSQDEGAIFFRLEPSWQETEKEKIEILRNLGFRKSLNEIQPKDTLILDLTKSEEELLKEMHHKTRYNIRLARKRGVKIYQTTSSSEIEIFYRLLTQTTKRDKFSSHPKEYYQKQLEILGKKGFLKLFFAEYQKQVIAAILVSFYNQRATYLHGALDFNFRNLMAPHLLQMEAILTAKRLGCKIYDFWGIAPSGAVSHHPWQGITRFKRGFGGKEINYLGGWDYVFNKFWYLGYNLSHKLNSLNFLAKFLFHH